MNQFNPMANRSPARSGAQAAYTLPRRRYWLVCALMLVWVGLIVSKLFWLQILRHHEFVEKAQKQQQLTFKVAPRRGILYDRNLRELAMTVQADSLFAVPSQIEDKKATVHALAQIVHTAPDDAWTSEAQITERINASRGFAWVARKFSPEIAARIKALNLKGVYFQKEFQRFYPDNDIAAQVLGYVGMDDNGLGGIEQKFDARLHGEPGRMFAAMDARRHVLGSTVHEPEPGENLVLSIDENIQFLAEKALDRAMLRTQSATGTVVIQDVHTGQILALAVRPTFNPNDFHHATPQLLRNHAVSDVYEPGSTFKLVTYAAAIDQHLVTPDDKIDCQNGAITFNGRTIHDDVSDHFGVVTVHYALEHSSDVAAVKLALKLGPERFSGYVHDFGFGAKTGMELPGETRGLLRPTNKWGATSIGSIAMGQEIAVTPLQLVSMVSTIANGGVYLPPHIVIAAQPKDAAAQNPSQSIAQSSSLEPQPLRPGGELPSPLPQGAHRVISTMAAAQMRKMMEGVVLYGSGKLAQLNGYSSGGKTGTAQKIDPATRAYSKTMHVSSFAGIAPVNSPVIAVAVILDDPKGNYYGWAASAPVFAEVSQQTLEYLGVPHDVEVRSPQADEKKGAAKQHPEQEREQQIEPRQEHTGDVNALIGAVNELPPDDPLREAVSNSRAAQRQKDSKQTPAATPTITQNQQAPKATETKASNPPETVPVPVEVDPGGNGIKVPMLVGLPVRKVVEQVAMAGLNLQVMGRGLVRSQQPVAGSTVQPGSQVVVRCAR